jgi:glycosyltransferase involved in cell wall biosynthesis
VSNQLLINLPFIISRPTGITTYALNLLPHLKRLDPTLLVAQPIPDYNCHSTPAKLTPEQGKKGHFRRLIWTQFQLPKIYQKLQAKLLFSPNTEAPLNGNCRYVTMVHDVIPLRFGDRFSPLKSYFRYYIPQVLQQAEHIVCNSIATAKDIVDFYNIPAQKITPIVLAYDRNNFRQLNIDSFKEQPPYLLYLGRHDTYKNLLRLLDAFALITCRDCQLWFAGPPDKRNTPTLQTKITELGLSDRVKFLDYVPYQQLPILLNQAIALVFPTLWEGFGFPVLEAMACGTPVITSNLSSLPEVAAEAALLIDPYNVAEIASAMQTIVEDSQLRSHLSHLSLQRASQFSWEKTGQATVEILQKFL